MVLYDAKQIQQNWYLHLVPRSNCVSAQSVPKRPSLNWKKKLTSHVVAAIDPVDLHAARCGGTLLGGLLSDLE
jgi:hypothetical protein